MSERRTTRLWSVYFLSFVYVIEETYAEKYGNITLIVPGSVKRPGNITELERCLVETMAKPVTDLRILNLVRLDDISEMEVQHRRDSEDISANYVVWLMNQLLIERNAKVGAETAHIQLGCLAENGELKP